MHEGHRVGPATLDAWLADSDKLIPGQRMNIATADAKARGDIVAFLRSISSR